MKPRGGTVNDKEVAHQLSKLHSLFQDGVISEIEFEQAQRKVLASVNQGDTPSVNANPSTTESAQNKLRNNGCFRFILATTLIFIAFAAWLGSEDSGGDPGGDSSGDSERPLTMVHGEIYLVGDTATYNGIGCNGAGEYAFVTMDTPLQMSAGGTVDLETFIAAGSAVHREGSCQFTFFGELHDNGVYEITVGEGEGSFSVSCPTGLVTQSEGDDQPVLDVEIQVDSNGEKCVTPST